MNLSSNFKLEGISWVGHDTTASAISWILLSLAEHPDFQRKCQDEIDKVVSETDSGELEGYGWRHNMTAEYQFTPVYSFSNKNEIVW